MTLGIVMLVHDGLDRAEQVARHWAAAGCPVVIHVDRSVSPARNRAFRARFDDVDLVLFGKRHRCEWGTWGIVAATQSAAELLLERFDRIGHVLLTSGSCLPLRPVGELCRYLDDRPQTDFIESATTADVPWTKGGLDLERFTLRFPFSWRRNRWLFDAYVDLQRRLRVRRTIPDGLVPHMGSQWWCLSRRTLSRILNDPERRTIDRYFKTVWIPDECYFQTLARRHSQTIESRSLTLSKFDFQGKPHIFYDDHLQLLRRSDCFVARKIWSRADRLYGAFLGGDGVEIADAEPNPGRIDRVFSKAVQRRTEGRRGLYMQSRWPHQDWENGITAAPYSVCQGISEVFEDFEPWLARQSGARVHGHLYAPDRVEFEGRVPVFQGAMTDSPRIRDHAPQIFLTNLIWNTRGERQAFQFGPGDTQSIAWMLAKDANAQISVVSGAWAVPLFRSDRDFVELRIEAARLQKIENDFLSILKSPWVKARIRIWTMADFIENPKDALQEIVDEMTDKASHCTIDVPRMHDLSGFGGFLQDLKNQGMHPYLMGDFPATPLREARVHPLRKPYLVP